MSNILEDLKRYFRETPHEQVMKDWAETEKDDEVGPTVHEFLQNTQVFFCMEDPDDLISRQNNLNDFFNPEYSLGFLLLLQYGKSKIYT